MKKQILLFTVCLWSVPLLAQIDYVSEIQPIFNSNCNACHSAGQNSFNSSSYSAVIASTSPSNRYNRNHVIPNDAAGSPLVDKIEPNPQFGSRMPRGGQLTTDEINKIKQWINEGAQEQVSTSNENDALNPTQFKLLGNYPNPFNPSTTIRFQIPVSSEFRITIYNANGQLVNTISGNASAGLKEETVDLSRQPSGIYFYRVRAVANGRFSLVGSGKMTLVK